MKETQAEGARTPRQGRTAIRKLGKRLEGFAGLRQLLGVARRAAAVAEMPGGPSIHISPAPLTTPQTCQGLTIISSNLWHDWPKRRRALERLEAFAGMAEAHQADVLLLQEVARTRTFWSDRWLADRLSMGYVYSRANGHLDGIGFEEGLAIFSRFPVAGPVLRQLNSRSSRFVHRMALGARIVSPCGDLMAFSVHLGLAGRSNGHQAARLSTWVHRASAELPALVGGDFNATEGSHQIQNLRRGWLDTFRHLNPLTDATTHELRWPWGRTLRRARLDYIFLKAEHNLWNILEARHLMTPGEPHSDHRAVLLRLAPVAVRA